MIEAPSVLRRRVLGLVFFVVLALFLAFTIGTFNKTFKDVVKIDLVTDTVGNALPPNADVKVRGLLVGEVRSASTKDGQVTSVLAIEPDKVITVAVQYPMARAATSMRRCGCSTRCS